MMSSQDTPAETTSLSWPGVSGRSGVSPDRRGESDLAIDRETFIVLTAWLRDQDPRLRDEAIDRCICYGQYVSRLHAPQAMSPHA